MITVAITTAALVLIPLGLHKELVAVHLDRETAQAIGLPVFWLDLTLYVMPIRWPPRRRWCGGAVCGCERPLAALRLPWPFVLQRTPRAS